MEIQINFLAVGIAVVANFILGALWYGPLFGKAWAAEMGMNMEERPERSVVYRGMLLMVLGNFLMAYCYAHDLFAWSNVPGMENMGGQSWSFILMSAFFTWLGFYVPTHIGAVTWERKSWKLTGINLAYHFATLFVAASLIVKLG
jgi:hypothetical protein